MSTTTRTKPRSVTVRVDDTISLRVMENTLTVMENGLGIGTISRPVASAIFWELADELASAFQQIPQFGANAKDPYGRP